MALTKEQIEERRRTLIGDKPSGGKTAGQERLERLGLTKPKSEPIESEVREQGPGSNFLSKGGEVTKDIAIGAGKGFLSTIRGMSSLGEKGLKGITKTILPKSLEPKTLQDKETSAEKLISKEMIKPRNTAQNIGFITEQIAEFIIPATKINTAAKAAKLGFLPRVATEALTSVGQTALQEGEFNQDVKRSGIISTALPIGGKLIGTPARKLGNYFFRRTIPTTPLEAGKDMAKGLNIGEAVGNTGISMSKKSLSNKLKSEISKKGSKLGNIIKEESSKPVIKGDGFGILRSYNIDDITKGLKDEIMSSPELMKKVKATPIDKPKIEEIVDDVINDYRVLYKGKNLNVEELQGLKVALGDGLENEFNKSVGAVTKAKPLTEIQIRSRIQKMLEDVSPKIGELNKELAPLFEASKRLGKKGGYSGYLTDIMFGGLYAGNPQEVLSDPTGYLKNFLSGVVLKRAGTSTAAKTAAGTSLRKIDTILNNPKFKKGLTEMLNEIISTSNENNHQ